MSCSVTDAAGNQATATRRVEVFNEVPKSLSQAAYVLVGTTYAFGFNSIENVQIVGAPADTDRTRFAMLNDGNSFRIYFFKVGSNVTLYQFVFNTASNNYEYGFVSGDFTITGAPKDTDFSRWAMLHDGEKYRLYFFRQKSSAEFFQFIFFRHKL